MHSFVGNNFLKNIKVDPFIARVEVVRSTKASHHEQFFPTAIFLNFAYLLYKNLDEDLLQV